MMATRASAEARICKKHDIIKSLLKSSQLLLAFFLAASLQTRLFPNTSINSFHTSSSLRVQNNNVPQRRRLLESLPNNAINQFDILVPVFERDSNLRGFAARLKPSLLEYAQLTANKQTKITTFRLLTTKYGDQEQASSTQFQQELSQLIGLPVDQVVMVHAPAGATFSRAQAVNLLLNAACPEPSCLVARVDVDMDVKPSFFLNSERDVQAGQTAYFPIVWSAFHPAAPQLVQFQWDVSQMLKKETRQTLAPDSSHRGHWRDYGTGMWAVGGQDAKQFRFNEDYIGWGGEDGDFYNRVKTERKIVRSRESGLVHLWHPKYCTRGVTVFTDTQVAECNNSREGEKGSDQGKKLLDKWMTQNQPEPVVAKPIWQA